MARVDLRAFSNNPPDDATNLWIGVLFAAVGALMLAWLAVQIATQPWDLAETGVVTRGTKGERSPFRGDYYVIEVEGKRHTCYRGMRKFPSNEAPILYDPADPSRCRAIDALDGLSKYERSNLGFGTVFFAMGLALVLAWYAEPRPMWAREDPPPLLRPGLMWVARGLAGIAVVAIVVFVYGYVDASSLGREPPPMPATAAPPR